MKRLEQIIEEMQSLNVDPLRIDEEIRKLECELSEYLLIGGEQHDPKNTGAIREGLY